MTAALGRARAAVHAAFWVTGFGLSLYLAAATFGYVRGSSEHYSNFVFAVLLMCGFLSMRTVLDGRIANREVPWFWTRLSFVTLVTALAGFSAGYIRYHAVRLEMVQPFYPAVDFYVGLALTVAVMLLCWLHWGTLLTTIISLSIVYFFFGSRIPYPLLQTPRYDPEFVISYIGLGMQDGLFWFAREAADNIWFLVLFAGALFAIGTLNMVLELGKMAGNRIAGGAAFPALIGSGIVSAIMGTAVSNVILTGRFTIPMMMQKGYRASMAGAIEGAASTSGQIMPPVMGLAAFIIAALLNIPYIDVAMAALIPGLLYMTGISAGVLVYARRHNLPKLTEQVDYALIARLMPTFLISFGAVLVLLLGYYSPSLAGVTGIVLALAFGLLQGRYRMRLRELSEAFREALEMAAILSLLLIAIGPLGQVFMTTGLSTRLGTLMIMNMPDIELVLLVGAAVLSLILGMGLPTPVAYVVVALALVPFMQQLGVPALMAHMFVFYFACYSALTPPVMVSVLAAAKISGASIWDTAVDSMKLMLTTFVIPFAFVYYPSLMSFPNPGWEILIPLTTVLVLQWTVSVACYGYHTRVLTGFERFLFAVASLAGYAALTHKGITSNLIFAAILVAVSAFVPIRSLMASHLAAGSARQRRSE